MEFNVEKELVNNGYTLDCEKDIRSTYIKGFRSVTLHWDGEMLNDEGICISMTVQNIKSYNTEKPINFGKRPENIDEFNTIFCN